MLFCVLRTSRRAPLRIMVSPRLLSQRFRDVCPGRSGRPGHPGRRGRLGRLGRPAPRRPWPPTLPSPLDFTKGENQVSMRRHSIAILKSCTNDKKLDVNPRLQYRNSGKSVKHELNRGPQHRIFEHPKKK